MEKNIFLLLSIEKRIKKIISLLNKVINKKKHLKKFTSLIYIVNC